MLRRKYWETHNLVVTKYTRGMPNVKKGKSGLEYIPAKDSTITFKCVNYNKSYEEEFDDGLTKRSKNTYVFVMEIFTSFV